MVEITNLYPNQKPRKPRVFKKRSVGPKTATRATKKRKPKNPLKKARKDLWELCKALTRKKYGNVCFTCGAENLSGGNWHTAHFIARSVCGLYLRYDLRNLRPGCYRCNVSLAGNGANYYRFLVEREGQAYVDGIFADKSRETKENLAFYEEMIGRYRRLLEELGDKSDK